ncbi:MAG: WbqC family protein [Candidatus Paceibacterota bacterium]
MVVGVLQPSYLPWLGYFDQIDQSNIFIFYDTVQYDKNGWRNRNKIKTKNGIQWLTVPITKKDGLLKDVEIVYESDWVKKHLESIKQTYGKYRFFEEVYEIISNRLLLKYGNLSMLCCDLIVDICRYMDMDNIMFMKASDLPEFTGDANERLVKMLMHVNGTMFIEGASGINYINDKMFARNGIEVKFQNYECVKYDLTVNENLSVVDALFRFGKDTINVVQKGRKS